MSKSKNHTIKIVVYNRLSKGRMSIGVRGRYGSKVLGMFTTGLIIKEKAINIESMVSFIIVF
mgnify:CR=1 FL=1